MGIEDIAWDRSIGRCHVNLHPSKPTQRHSTREPFERGGRSSWRLSGTATTTPIVGVSRRRPLLVPPRSHDPYPGVPATNLPAGGPHASRLTRLDRDGGPSYMRSAAPFASRVAPGGKAR